MKKSSIVAAVTAISFCLSPQIFAGTAEVKKNLQLAESGDVAGQF